MSVENQIDRIAHHVREYGTYVDRDYKTMGGMWTVDTWVLDSIRVQLQDEGATWAILTPTLNVSFNWNQPVVFRLGDADELNRLYLELIENSK